jgi:hypothetical protein
MDARSAEKNPITHYGTSIVAPGGALLKAGGKLTNLARLGAIGGLGNSEADLTSGKSEEAEKAIEDTAVGAGASVILGTALDKIAKKYGPKVAEKFSKLKDKFKPKTTELTDDFTKMVDKTTAEATEMPTLDQVARSKAGVNMDPDYIPENASEEAAIEEALNALKGRINDNPLPPKITSPKEPERVIERFKGLKKSWEKGAPVAEATPTPTENAIRAKPQYHGTGKDIEEYKLLSPSNKLKAENSSPSDAVFFTDKPDVASEFAESRANKDWAPRVYKSVVSPENTFNPKEPNKIEALKKALIAQGEDPDSTYIKTLAEELKDNKNSWRLIEDPKVQDAMKEAGFDSFYITEAGKRNLGVLDPNIAKQAATRSQRAEALKKIKEDKIKKILDKIIAAEKE